MAFLRKTFPTDEEFPADQNVEGPCNDEIVSDAEMEAYLASYTSSGRSTMQSCVPLRKMTLRDPTSFYSRLPEEVAGRMFIEAFS